MLDLEQEEQGEGTGGETEPQAHSRPIFDSSPHLSPRPFPHYLILAPITDLTQLPSLPVLHS